MVYFKYPSFEYNSIKEHGTVKYHLVNEKWKGYTIKIDEDLGSISRSCIVLADIMEKREMKHTRYISWGS